MHLMPEILFLYPGVVMYAPLPNYVLSLRFVHYVQCAKQSSGYKRFDVIRIPLVPINDSIPVDVFLCLGES
jgi:hypothetical protein